MTIRPSSLQSPFLFFSGVILSAVVVGGLAAAHAIRTTYNYETSLEDAQKEIHALQHELDPTHARFAHGENMAEQVDDHAHSHETPIDLTGRSWNPSVHFTVTPDPVSGWNLHLQSEHFRFSPENAGREHVEGEGHAHLYVDGEKVARLYGDWFHVASLPAGEHELRVALTSNDHHPFVRDGMKLESTATIMAQ